MTTKTTIPPLVFESEWTHLRLLVDLLAQFARGQNTNDWQKLWTARENADLFLSNFERRKS